MMGCNIFTGEDDRSVKELLIGSLTRAEVGDKVLGFVARQAVLNCDQVHLNQDPFTVRLIILGFGVYCFESAKIDNRKDVQEALSPKLDYWYAELQSLASGVEISFNPKSWSNWDDCTD